MKNISENKAAEILIQVYLFHTSKWYASFLTLLIGAIGFPLLAFSIKQTAIKPIEVHYLYLISGMTIIFTIFALYLLHKVFYSLQFLEELYDRLSMASGASLRVYKNNLQLGMQIRSRLFEHLVRRDKDSRNKKGISLHNSFFYLSFILALVGGLALLVLVFGLDYKQLAIWGGTLIGLIVLYFLFKIV
jgi:hypothetical protein